MNQLGEESELGIAIMEHDYFASIQLSGADSLVMATASEMLPGLSGRIDSLLISKTQNSSSKV